MTGNSFQIVSPLMIFSVSWLVALVLVRTVHLHGHLSMDHLHGVQKLHHEPTPRVGGIAILAGLLVALLVVRPERRMLLWPMMLAGIPALFFGLTEDLTKRVGIRTRLMATMSCSVIGWFITGFSITGVNVPVLNWLLQYTVVSVMFTAVAVAGIANAINIVDGLNGMAGGAIMIILAAFALIAYSLGDIHIARLCFLLVAAVAGFLLVNWPFGQLFLGDGGAYFMGFSIGWLAVLMLARHSEISAWALVLVCAHPIFEVLFSMWRRYRRKRSPGSADCLHLHSLVLRRVARRLLPYAQRRMRNSAAGAMMWLVTLMPASLAVIWPTRTPVLVACLLLCGVLYTLVYQKIVRFGLRFEARVGKRCISTSRSQTQVL